LNKDIKQKCEQAAFQMRKNALKMANLAGNNGAHLGGGLSIIEIMATLYCGVLKYKTENPQWEQRDRFILSKGHGTLSYYTALAAAGIITEEQLFTFEQNGGLLPGQPSVNLDIGIECSSGSLGLSLSYAVGICIALKKRRNPNNVYVLLGDGECNEGANWEAAMSAKHYALSNLTAIIDSNSMQSDGKTCDVLNVDLASMWKGFGWEVIPVDGHNVEKLYNAFTSSRATVFPRVIIAQTKKGKGVSFIENNNEWHHNVLPRDKFEAAMFELRQDGAV